MLNKLRRRIVDLRKTRRRIETLAELNDIFVGINIIKDYASDDEHKLIEHYNRTKFWFMKKKRATIS